MAFTLSHMAAALPFYRWRKWISFEALLLGTMLPDLPYFLNSSQAISEQSHSWPGLLSYCLPWGLGIFALWHWLLKPAAIALLQPWLAITVLVSPHEFQQWIKAGITIILGLLLGSSTHLIWDGITHPDGFIARHVIWLQLPINISNFDSMPLARFLQYASSLLALCYLGWFIQKHLQPVAGHKVLQNNMPIIIVKKWQSLLIICLVCAGSLFYGWHGVLKSQGMWAGNTYLFLARLLVSVLQGAAGVFILYAFAYQLLYRLRRSQQGATG